MGSSDFTEQALSIPMHMGLGLTEHGVNLVRGAIAGDPTHLSAFVPPDARPLVATLMPLISSATSGIYDSALGWDSNKHGHLPRPSSAVGNRTAAQVAADDRIAGIYSDYVKPMVKGSAGFDKDVQARNILRMLSGKTGAAADKFADEQLRSNSMKAQFARSAASIGAMPLENSYRSVARDYARIAGIYNNGNLSKQQQQQLLNIHNIVRDRYTAGDSYNSSADISNLVGAELQNHASQLRYGNSKDIATRIAANVRDRAAAYDSLRSMYGKNASAAMLSAQLDKMGIINADPSTVKAVARDLERLSVNLGMDASRFSESLGLGAQVAEAAGLDRGLYGHGLSTTLAALTGKGTTVRGLTDEAYAAGLGEMAARAAVSGDVSNEVLRREYYKAANGGSLKGYENSAFASAKTDAELNRLASNRGVASSVLQNIRENIGDSSEYANASRQVFMKQAQGVRGVFANALAKSGITGDAADAWMGEFAHADTQRKAQMLSAAGMRISDVDAAGRRYGLNRRATLQLLASGRMNSEDFNRTIPATTNRKYSRNGVEALDQVMRESKGMVTPAQAAHALFASESLPREITGASNQPAPTQSPATASLTHTTDPSIPKQAAAPKSGSDGLSDGLGEFTTAVALSTEALKTFVNALSNMPTGNTAPAK